MREIFFGDFLRDWYALMSIDLRPRTCEQYSAAVRVISEAVGDRLIGDLTPIACAAVYAPIVAAGHSRTAQIVFTIFRAALRGAVETGVLQASPMQGLKRPRYDGRDVDPFSDLEVSALLSDPKHGFAWRLLLSTGLRRGEACALQWRDVDFGARVIRVTRQLVRANGVLIEGPPKSSAGKRRIGMPDDLADALRGQLRAQMAAGRRGDYVVSTDGCRVEPRALNRWLTAAAHDADVLDAHPHRFRHTFGADAVSAGIDIRVLQRLLGHSDIKVTAKYYAYVRDDVLCAASRRIAAYRDGVGT